MKTINRRTAANAIFLILQAMLGSATASAASIKYDFSEAGWVDMAGTAETFSGSFTGTPEANGQLALIDLSSFSATITETNAQGQTKDISVFASATSLADFLYLPYANTFRLAATGSPASTICLGDAVTTGFCGALPARAQPKPGSNPLPPIEGLFSFSVNGSLNGYTTDLPFVVQAISPVPAPVPANAPEPASFILCGGALLILSKLLRRAHDRRFCSESNTSGM